MHNVGIAETDLAKLAPSASWLNYGGLVLLPPHKRTTRDGVRFLAALVLRNLATAKSNAGLFLPYEHQLVDLAMSSSPLSRVLATCLGHLNTNGKKKQRATLLT